VAGLWPEEVRVATAGGGGAGEYARCRARMFAAERQAASEARAADFEQRLAVSEAEAAELRAHGAGFSGRVHRRLSRLMGEQGGLMEALHERGELGVRGLERQLRETTHDVRKGQRLLRTLEAGRRGAGEGLERRRMLLLKLRTALLRVQYDLHHAARFEAFLQAPPGAAAELLRRTPAEGQHVLQVFRVCYRTLEGGRYTAVEPEELLGESSGEDSRGGGGAESFRADAWVSETLPDGERGFGDFMEALRHGVKLEVPNDLMQKISGKAAGTRTLPLYPGNMLLTANAIAWLRPARSALMDAKVFYCVEERLSRVAAPEEFASFSEHARSPDVQAALGILDRGVALPTRGRPRGSVVEGHVRLGHSLRGRAVALHFAPATVANLLETRAAVGLLTASDVAAELCSVYFSDGLRPACLGGLYVLEDTPTAAASSTEELDEAIRGYEEGAGSTEPLAQCGVEGGSGWLGKLSSIQMVELCDLYVRREVGLEGNTARHAWPAPLDGSHALTLVHRRCPRIGDEIGLVASLGSPALLIVSSPRALESSHSMKRRTLAALCDWKRCEAPPMAFLGGSALCELHARVAASTGAEASGLSGHTSRGLGALDLLDMAEAGGREGVPEDDWRWVVESCEPLCHLRSGGFEGALEAEVEELVLKPWPTGGQSTCPGRDASGLPCGWVAAEEELMRLSNACDVAFRELRVQSKVVADIEGVLGSRGGRAPVITKAAAVSAMGGASPGSEKEDDDEHEAELTEVNNRVLSILQLCTGGDVQSGRLSGVPRPTMKSRALYCSRGAGGGGGGGGGAGRGSRGGSQGLKSADPLPSFRAPGHGLRPEWQD